MAKDSIKIKLVVDLSIVSNVPFPRSEWILIASDSRTKHVECLVQKIESLCASRE